MRRPRSWLRRALLAGAAVMLLAVAVGAYAFYRLQRRPPALSATALCRLGAYELPDGELVAVRQREGEQLRVVFFDGWTRAVAPAERDGVYHSLETRPAGAPPALAVEFGDCAEGRLTWRAAGAEPRTARRLQFDVHETTFRSGDVDLAGRLLLPVGDRPVPVVVLVHGSERDAALTGSHWQYLLPAKGVGAFVYDKRGTGSSGGRYTQDFDRLAADATAAAGEARRLAGARVAELGYLGGSQGGWVAPLAARVGGADFVIAAYGLAESPLAEDREEVLLGLREAGFDDAATAAKALEVVAATGRVMASGFRDGFDELAAVRERYRHEPWFAHVHGEFSGDFLRFPAWILRRIGPRLDVGTSWEYDPLPTLEAIAVPHLWILAGADREAPSANTFARLREIQTRRSNLDVARFPTADHGIWVEEKDASGAIRYSGYARGYHELVLRWISTYSLNGAAEGIETWEGDTLAAEPPAIAER